MTKKKTTAAKKETVVVAGPSNVPTPKPEKRAKGELSAEQATEALMPIDPKEADESEKPSAQQPIPPVKEKVNKPKTDKDGDVEGLNDASTENELAFGNFPADRSMKFTIDPDTIKAPHYAVEDFRNIFEKFRKEKGVKANNLFINTDSLEKLGYRDVATDLGLHIKESTVYKEKEMLLAVDL